MLNDEWEIMLLIARISTNFFLRNLSKYYTKMTLKHLFKIARYTNSIEMPLNSYNDVTNVFLILFPSKLLYACNNTNKIKVIFIVVFHKMSNMLNENIK